MARNRQRHKDSKRFGSGWRERLVLIPLGVGGGGRMGTNSAEDVFTSSLSKRRSEVAREGTTPL